MIKKFLYVLAFFSIIGGYYVANAYSSLISGNTFSSTHSTTVIQVVAIDGGHGGWTNTGGEAGVSFLSASTGTLSHLQVMVSSTPQSGGTFLFTLKKNQSNTTVTCTISNPNTTCTDTTHTATSGPRDLWTLSASSSGTGTNEGTVSWTFDLSATTTPVAGQVNSLNAATLLTYVPVIGGTTNNTTENKVQMIMPTAGTFKNLYARNGTTQNATSGRIAYLRVNSATSALSCFAGSSAGTICSDNSNTQAVVAGDLINFELAASGTPAAASTYLIGAEFTPNNTTSSIELWGQNGSANTSGSNFQPFYTYTALNPSTQESITQQPVSTAGTVNNLYVWSNTSQSANKGYQIYLRKNGARTSLTATILGSTVSSTDSSDSVSIVKGDLLDYEIVASGTPTAATGMSFSVVFGPPRSVIQSKIGRILLKFRRLIIRQTP